MSKWVESDSGSDFYELALVEIESDYQVYDKPNSTNLYKELVSVLTENNLSVDDIRWVEQIR